MKSGLLKKQGFTIVELLIAIVIIGILAAITIVSFNAVTSKARDAARKSDLTQIAKALNMYYTSKGNTIESSSGCGVNGNGNGWLNAGPSDLGASLYPKSIIDCLKTDGVLTQSKYADPSGCIYDQNAKCGTYDGNGVTAYMKTSCTKSGSKVAYVMGHVENGGVPASEIDGLCDTGSVSGFTADGQKWGSHYGMNYYVKAI